MTLVRNQRNPHTSVRSLGIAAGLTVLTLASLLLLPACHTGPSPTRVQVELTDRLDSANGYDWRAATQEARATACQQLVDNLGTAADYGSTMASAPAPPSEYLCEALAQFYNTSEARVLEQKIKDAAAT